MNEKNIFQTTDLYLAAALKISGFKLIDIARHSNGRGIFIFGDKTNRTQTVREYYSGELKGSLKQFSSAWSDLKALIVEMGMEQRNGKP